jgi:tetratricopeptide (TPR) repeat protein
MYLHECFEYYKKKHGYMNQLTLESLKNVSLNCKMLGKVSDAIPLFLNLCDALKTFYGQKHPETLLCMTELAILYRFQLQYERAYPLYEECYHTTAELFGKEHFKTILCMNNLANLYTDMKRFKDAESLYESCIEFSIKEFGTDPHPKVLQYRNNLALLYIDQGDTQKGCDMLQVITSNLVIKILFYLS